MSNYQISLSTELMQNYLQADVMGPQEKFLALQTNKGAALLFSISTAPEKVFYVTKEVLGDIEHKHGWIRRDLRGDQIKRDFPTGTCKDFAAAQHVHDSTATIQLALVVNDGTNDHLYLSVGNSDSDTSWTDAPKWTACPFNAKDTDQRPLTAPQPFQIANVFISEAKGEEQIVVDVIRDPQNPGPLISRYFIDVSTPASPAWHAHDVDVQLEAEGYKTCRGRQFPAGEMEEEQPSDGLYTSGVVSSHSQFTYKPLKSPYGEPASSILKLTADDSPPPPDAIAACRKPDDTSDLYAAHGGSLYYFASNKQYEGDVALKIVENRLFTGVKDLFASVTKGIVTVWGRNGSDEVFYITCPLNDVQTSSSWSTPLAIMTGVQNVTPYVNKADSAKIFFAHTEANEFKIAVKSPRKNGSWSVRNVHLPRSQTKQPARSFRSYTSRVSVTGEGKQPAAGVGVVITGTNRTSVYINHLYYVVGPVPITVKTDPRGCLTIVEEVTRVDGTQLTLSVDGDALGKSCTINPMHDSSTVIPQMQKLRTSDDLAKAKIRNQKDKTTRSLVTKPGEVATTATNIDYLFKAHDHLTQKRMTLVRGSEEPSERYKKFVGGRTVTKVDAGDLLMWHEHKVMRLNMSTAPAAMLGGGESWWDIIVEWFEGAWNFILKIGEEIFAFVIEVVEQVFEGLALVLQKVVDWLKEEALDFFKWLFDVDNIVLTKQVMKNVMLRFLEEQVDGIHVLKGKIDESINSLIGEVDKWAGLDWSKRLGEYGKATPNGMTESKYDANAPMWMLGDHFTANAGDAEPVSPDKLPAPPSGSLDIFWHAVKEEIGTLGQVKLQLDELVKDAPTMAFADIVKRFLGIVGHLGLQTVETAIDALLDILYDIATKTLKALDAKIYIPVVSDILDEWGLPPFSLLDVLCYVAAAPTTWIFDLAVSRPPFEKGPDTTSLIEATDFQSIKKKLWEDKVKTVDSVLDSTVSTLTATDLNPSKVGAGFSPPPEGALILFAVTRAFTTIWGTFSVVIGPLEALQPSNVARAPIFDKVLTFPNLLLTLSTSTFQVLGTAVLAGYAPPPRIDWFAASTTLSAAHVASTVFFCQPLWEWWKGIKGGNFWNRELGAGFDTGLGVASMIVAAFRMSVLFDQEEGVGKTLAIRGEISNMFSGYTRLCRFLTIIMPDAQVEGKAMMALVMGIGQAAYTGSQASEFAAAVSSLTSKSARPMLVAT